MTSSRSANSRTKPRGSSGARARPVDDVTAYALAVQAGEIIAGPHVRAAANRHLDDLEKGPARSLYFDEQAAQDFFDFCAECCTVTANGKTVPFVLSAAQRFKYGSIFGWKVAQGNALDFEPGTRRFRTAFIEEGKGNGKSPGAAAVGLYFMLADGEANAEVYAAGSKKDQAMVLFRDAVSMVSNSPELSSRVVKSGVRPVWQLSFVPTNSFFKPIANDEGQSGPRPSCGLIDEIHEHKDRYTVDMLEAGFKSRSQPLLFIITNSGTDRQTVAYEYHEHACHVAAQEIEDDSFFAFVCALDQGHSMTYRGGRAISEMAKICTCCNVPLTLIDRFTQAASARLATTDGTEQRAPHDAPITRSDRLKRKGSARLATPEPGFSQTLSAHLSEKVSGNGSLETATTFLTTSGNGTRTNQAIDPKSSENSACDSMESKRNPTNSSFPPRMAGAGFATSALAESSASTIATTPESIAAYYAQRVIPPLVFSEILPKVWGAHSPTCDVRKASIDEDSAVFDYPADDPFTDESCWVKANPELDVILKRSYVRKRVQDALHQPSKQNDVLRLNFCIWTEADRAWMTKQAWEATERRPPHRKRDLVIEDFVGAEAYGGLDLSFSQDLTARALDFPDTVAGALHHHLFLTFWSPEETMLERERRDRVPYSLWVKQGLLTPTQGKIVQMGEVGRQLHEDQERFDLRFVAFDRYRHKDLKDRMADAGFDPPMIEHPQGFRRAARLDEATAARFGLFDEKGAPAENPLWMPGSIEEFEHAIIEERLWTPVNAVLRWNIAGVTPRDDPAGTGNKVFDKRKATGRIDGAVAAAMAIGAAAARFTDGGSALLDFLANPVMTR